MDKKLKIENAPLYGYTPAMLEDRIDRQLCRLIETTLVYSGFWKTKCWKVLFIIEEDERSNFVDMVLNYFESRDIDIIENDGGSVISNVQEELPKDVFLKKFSENKVRVVIARRHTKNDYTADTVGAYFEYFYRKPVEV